MKLTSDDRKACTQHLDALLDRCHGAQAAMLALRDGRSFAQLAHSALNVDKFAAMSSSLAALGETILDELGCGIFDHVLVEGSKGRLVVAKISGLGGMLILSTLVSADTRPGLVLGYTRSCAVSIHDTLQQARAAG